MTPLTAADVLALVRDRQNITLTDAASLLGIDTLQDHWDELVMIQRVLLGAGWRSSIVRLPNSDAEVVLYERPQPEASNDPAPHPAPTAADAPPFTLATRATTAHTILHDAADAIADRAASRDVSAERSMARCVAAFNAMTGHALTEVDGWWFMVFLKCSRSRAGAHNPDDYLDGAAYVALAGEAAHGQAEREVRDA